MAKRTCSTEGCNKAHYSKGRCRSHYERWRRAVRTPNPCSIEGCEKPSFQRGWCAMHHWRWRSNGDPLAVRRIVGDDTRRLWSKIDKRDPEECWPWTGSRDGYGYGQISIKGKLLKPYRVAYEIVVGEIPDGAHIDHRCHDPLECQGGPGCPHRLCCNPSHMLPVEPEVNWGKTRAASFQRQKTHCPQGHEYSLENTRRIPSKPNYRYCRTCQREQSRSYKARKRAVLRDL